MMAFELLEPTSLKDAIALIDPDDPEVRPIAGGTALMLMMKAGVFRPRRLVSLRKLGEAFTRIAAVSAGELTIGAMAPLSALEHSPVVARGAPVVVRTIRRFQMCGCATSQPSAVRWPMRTRTWIYRRS